MRRLLPVAIISCVWVAPAIAHATDAAPSDARDAAIKIAKDAAADYSAGRYPEALTKFDAAYKTFPADVLLLNLSHTQFKLGHCGDAVETAKKFAFLVPGNDAEQWSATLEKQCPIVEVRSDPSGASVLIDLEQKPIGVTPWKGPLLAGEHTLVVRLDGYRDGGIQLSVEEGKSSKVALSLAVANPVTAGPVVVPAPGGAAEAAVKVAAPAVKEAQGSADSWDDTSLPPIPEPDAPKSEEQAAKVEPAAPKVEPDAPKSEHAAEELPPREAPVPIVIGAVVKTDEPAAVPAKALAPASDSTPPPRNRTGQIVLWTSVGVVGAAALAVGGYFLFRGLAAPTADSSATVHGTWQ